MLFNCGVEDSRVPWTARRSNQSRLDAEAETQILWPPDAKI